MSRHRIVRQMKYEDEFYDDEDDYGQSYEDRYCISPGTAAQFTYHREGDRNLSYYEEKEEIQTQDAETPATFAEQGLQDFDLGKMQSCVEEIQNIMGDSIPDPIIKEAVLKHNFNTDAAVNSLLSVQDAPLPQRTPRKKRDRTQGDDTNIEELLSEIDSLDQCEHVGVKGSGVRFKYPKESSPSTGIIIPKTQEADKMIGNSNRSSPCSVGSSGSSQGGLTLSDVKRTLSAGRQSRGHVGCGSETSLPPIQTGNIYARSLTELTKHRGSSEQNKVSSALNAEKPETETDLSLADLVSLQKKPDLSQSRTFKPSGLMHKESGQRLGGNLSDLVSAHRSSQDSSKSALSASRETDNKPISKGISLTELLAKKSELSTTPSSSSSSSFSPMQETEGLSLNELACLHRSNQKTSHPHSDSISCSSLSSVSVPQLINESGSSKTLSHKEAGTGISSFAAGPSLSDLIKSHSTKRDHKRNNDKEIGQHSASSGGSRLSDLITQRQGNDRKSTSFLQQSSEVTDVNRNQIGETLGQAHSQKHGQTFNTRAQVKGDGSDGQKQPMLSKATDFSLVDCLKKSLAIRSEYHEPEPCVIEDKDEEMEEEEEVVSKKVEFIEDVFDPSEVDKAMKKFPSLFARCVSFNGIQTSSFDDSFLQNQEKGQPKFVKFKFGIQTKHAKIHAKRALVKNVARFDFSTPSPDDIVITRQKAAFTHFPEQHTV